MMYKKINFYYFSGTGNTLLVVKEMSKFFMRNKIEVKLNRIEKSNPKEIEQDGLLGFAFPVAMQSTYAFIWDFFENLKISENNTEVFMVDTMAGFSGGIVGSLKKLLQQKGYKPIAAKEIIMPKNYYFKTYNSEKNTNKIAKGLIEAKKFAHDIVFEHAKWRRIPLFSNMLSRVSRSEKAMGFVRNQYKLYVDSNRCLKCGLCYKLCPVDNISDSAIPEIHDNCQMCVRCISFCPTQAIAIEKKPFVQYQAVKSGELLKPKI